MANIGIYNEQMLRAAQAAAGSDAGASAKKKASREKGNNVRKATLSYLKAAMAVGLADDVLAHQLRKMIRFVPRSKSDNGTKGDRLFEARQVIFQESKQYKLRWYAGKDVRGVHRWNPVKKDELNLWISTNCGDGEVVVDDDGDDDDEYSDDEDNGASGDEEEGGEEEAERGGGPDPGFGGGDDGGDSGRGDRQDDSDEGMRKRLRKRLAVADPAIIAEPSAAVSGENPDSPEIIPLQWRNESKAFTPYGHAVAPVLEETENVPPVAWAKDAPPPLRKGHVVLTIKGNKAATGPLNKPTYLGARLAAQAKKK